MEKLNAKAKPIPCQSDCSFTKAIIIMIKQNWLIITVNAFFSLKYFFMIKGLGWWILHGPLTCNKYSLEKSFSLLIVGKKVKTFGQYQLFFLQPCSYFRHSYQ